MRRWPICLVGLVVILQGCGTITRGSSEAWVVESDPPGAEVEISTGHRCRTPCSVELKRKDGFVAKIIRDGYEPVEAVVTSQIAGAGAAAMAGNIIFGGLIGVAVDAGTGANKELKPNPLHVRLVPLAPAPVPAAGLVAQAPAPAWRQTPRASWSPSPPPSEPIALAPEEPLDDPMVRSGSLDYSVPAEVRAQPFWWKR